MDQRAMVKVYLEMAYRRRWWIVVPAVLGLLASVVVLQKLPKGYRAETTILVTGQSVPTDIVRSTVTLRIDERMKTLQIQVLSRNYLQKIIEKFKLVPEGASDAEIERACSKVRGQVKLEWDRKDFTW